MLINSAPSQIIDLIWDNANSEIVMPHGVCILHVYHQWHRTRKTKFEAVLWYSLESYICPDINVTGGEQTVTSWTQN